MHTSNNIAVPENSEDILLQAFYWDSYHESNWTKLRSRALEIANNFTLVWLPPSSYDKYAGMGYTPVAYFNQNNKFGCVSELKDLIRELKSYGVKCIADIVINHRAGNGSWGNFPIEYFNGEHFVWDSNTICCTDEIRHQYGQIKPTGAHDTGDDFHGARDIDHTNPLVRKTIKAYLSFLKNEMGYAGWRYDLVKGYAAGFVGEYNYSSQPYFSVGEYFDGNYDALKKWINETGNKSTAFDFSFKFALNNWAHSNDLTKLTWIYNGRHQPAGLIHHPETKRYATTFVDNHDTLRDHTKFTGNIRAANALMMCSPGIPCVSLLHWNHYQREITQMISARRSVGLHSESHVEMIHLSHNIYVAKVYGKTGKIIIKLGSADYQAPYNYKLSTSGHEYAIWIKPY